MKVTNHYYPTIEAFEGQFVLDGVDTERTLVQLFTGLIAEAEIEQIRSILLEKRSDITFIGTTTAGEIYEGSVQEKSIVVSVMEFEQTVSKQGYFSNDNDYQLGVDIASSLFVDNTKAMILFIDGLQTNGNDVVDGISSINNVIPVAGGMAGDNGFFAKTFVFDRSGVYSKGAVAVSLNSDVLSVFTDYQLNWKPIGQTMTITKAEKNRLYEIDGISASDIYTKYLGSKVGDNLPFSATEFPLLKIEEDGLEVCRTFIHRFEEDGSLLTIGNFEVGDRVRLAFGNVDLVLNSSKSSIQHYRHLQAEAIFSYSCTSRRNFLQSQVVTELSPLNASAPNCGFFTYGEIFHRNKKNSLLNISLTILALSESVMDDSGASVGDGETRDEAYDGGEKNIIANKHFLVLDALTHLSNTVIDELQESKKEIEQAHQHIKDSINYASIIQNAILPNDPTLLQRYTSDHFVHWEPKDTVGGDIYFIHELQSQEEIIIMVIDCTGHGVPGAFVTMLVKAVEKQVFFEINVGTLEPSPAAILAYFNKQLKTLLQQDADATSNAGFDGGIIYYNKRDQIIKFAGAETRLFYVDTHHALKTIKGSRHSVGYIKSDPNFQFTEHTLKAQPGMQFYLTTDGYLDQNGGEKGFPFGKRKFSNIIKENCTLKMSEQKKAFLDAIDHYEHATPDNDRNDDMTIIGIKV